MKKLFTACICITLFAGCKKTDDGNGNSTVTVVPITPTDLKANVISTTQVDLTWTDKSTNETGYKVQRKTSNGNYADIASTGVDITNYSDLSVSANTTYTYRVYAFNDAGNSLQYSNEVSVSTVNAASLPSIIIGTQIWTNINLDVDHYKNGDPIPEVTDPTEWANLTTGAWCWHNNDSTNFGAIYGRLYNWYALNDSRGLAPNGWHLPSSAEWNIMTKYLDPTVDTSCINCFTGTNIGLILKSNTGWDGTNNVGFSALPGAHRTYYGEFRDTYNYGLWWSNTASDFSHALCLNLININPDIRRINAFKQAGLSVRLVKD